MAGRSPIRKLLNIRSTSFLVVVALATGLVAPANGQSEQGPSLPSSRLDPASTARAIYPLGWFDSLTTPHLLPSMRSSGMNVVLPYTGESPGNLRGYLDRAQREGLKVYAEIDPALLLPPNPVLVRAFVELHRQHPAVHGWLLADEPTVGDKYRMLTPQLAEVLYQQIKSADPTRPVAIVFGVTENARPWVDAMDVLMYDDYVADAGTKEFRGLRGWLERLRERAQIAAPLEGYIPVLQAFGHDPRTGNPFMKKRLPTAKELRYITYAAIQHDSTGIMFWVHYRSRQHWIDRTLTPLSKEISPALRSMANGPVRGVSVSGGALRSTLFRDTRTNTQYLVVVHHGLGTVNAQVDLDPALRVVRAATSSRVLDVLGGRFADTFGPYAARLYRLT